MKPQILKAVTLVCSLGGISAAGLSTYVDAQSFAGAYSYIALWSYSPFFALGLSSILTESIFNLSFLAILSAALFVTSLFAFISNHLHPDAQGALIYLFLPIWQWVGIAVSTALGSAIWYLKKRRAA